MSEAAVPRAQPFYCPYCGEEDFVPFGEDPTAYLCRSCGRHYSVRFLGVVIEETADGGGTGEA